MRLHKLFAITLIFMLSVSIVGFFIQKWRAKTAVLSESDKLLEVAFLDVGQGDASLIVTPGGKTILVDGGPSANAELINTAGRMKYNLDAGSEIIIPFLKENKIKHLDYVIISHRQIDHIGGLISVLKNVRVKNIIEKPSRLSIPEYKEIQKIAKEKRINYISVKPYEVLKTGDPLVRVEFFDSKKTSSGKVSDEDNSSLLMKLTYNKTVLLFAGDVGQEAELDLVTTYKDKLKASVLKVPNHGSRTSSSNPFLDMVKPGILVISCGKQNPFGYPHEETLDRYSNRGLPVYRTDSDGTIVLVSDGTTHSIRGTIGIK